MVSLGFLPNGARVHGPVRCTQKGELLSFSRGEGFVIKEENILAQEHKGGAIDMIVENGMTVGEAPCSIQPMAYSPCFALRTVLERYSIC